VSSTPAPADPPEDNPRLTLALAIADAVRRGYPDVVQAIGVHGALAHGDDVDGSDVNLIVVTSSPGTGPPSGSRRVDGTIVDLGVISGEEYLEYARTLTTAWPLTADRYVKTRALHDPDGWHDRLRDTHLTRLAEAPAEEFAGLAREVWCQAQATYAGAIRLAGAAEPAGALLALGEARLAGAVVDGLLTRTYFRDRTDAIGRSGFGDADMIEVGRRLEAQAGELARRGRPVDTTVADLIG